ncbi:MAG: hypothetical protein J5717_02980 [Lachnospiraceae bacterium]|nr:hypothetical protein [Lachnospiraceae bacterium]
MFRIQTFARRRERKHFWQDHYTAFARICL